jgi:hypothetical protein
MTGTVMWRIIGDFSPNIHFTQPLIPFKNAFDIEKFLSTRFVPDKDERYINYEISAEDLAHYSK